MFTRLFFKVVFPVSRLKSRQIESSIALLYTTRSSEVLITYFKWSYY